MGFFGYSGATVQDGKRQPGQPLHHVVVDIDVAIEHTERLYSDFRFARTQSHAPAFSGGVLDSWPAESVEAFAILQAEHAAILSFLKSEQAQ